MKLVQDDRRQVYEAIAYVISAMPMNRAAESLRTFSLDILAQVHALSAKTTALTKKDIEEVGSKYQILFFFLQLSLTLHTDGLENLEVMLHVIQGYGEDLPSACQNTCQDAWLVFDAFLAKYATNYDLAERTTRVLRRGIDLFNKSVLPIATSIITRMSFAFEATGYPSFLWIAGKIIGRFGYEENSNFRGAVKELFERSTSKVASLLQVKTAGDIPDGEFFCSYLNMILM